MVQPVANEARTVRVARTVLCCLGASLLLVAVTGCEVKTAGYCCTTQDACDRDEGGGVITPCDDPSAPFCDNEGEFGVGRDCIPTPAGRCATPADCLSAELPECVDTVCVECATSDSCSTPEPFCNPTTNACERCTGDEACAATATTPRCETDSGNCVECLDSSDCGADEPICDDGACRGCTVGTECSSEVCDAGAGECVAASTVIYVATSGAATGSCTQGSPCNTIALALAQVDAGRNVIKVRPGTYTGQVTLSGIDVTIHGDGATIRPLEAGVDALSVTDGANVTVEGLTITGAAGSGNPAGVRCSGLPQSTLRLRRSTVIENANGVAISGCEFSLVNNVIALNGSATSLAGGVYIDQIATAGLHELAFNTVTANIGATNSITGVRCGLVGTPLMFSSNIVYGNQVSGTGTQVGGAAECAWSYSDIGPMPASGTGNINVDPQFVNAGSRDFHLQDSSPARNVADPDATLGVDLDGDVRPQGGRADMGADEVVR